MTGYPRAGSRVIDAPPTAVIQVKQGDAVLRCLKFIHAIEPAGSRQAAWIEAYLAMTKG
jgi:hypothetical protein